MLAVFWVIGVGAILLGLLQLAVAFRLASYVAPVQRSATTRAGERSPVSVLVPLKGAPRGLSARLGQLLDALQASDQLVVAMETRNDPAYQVVSEVQTARHDRDFGV